MIIRKYIPGLKSLTVYFNTSYILICINMHIGNHLSAKTDNFYSLTPALGGKTNQGQVK